MLLDEDPAALIHECTTNFNIYPDKAALARISESLGALNTARSLRLREAESALKKLSRTLNTVSQQHSITVSSHNPTEHASSILALDTQKFRVAKEASDLEIEGERLEHELVGLEGMLRELEAQGAQGAIDVGRDESEDQAILKLKLYRSLGIEAESDAVGNYTKAVVRNVHKGDVQVIDINARNSKAYYADHFWQAI